MSTQWEFGDYTSVLADTYFDNHPENHLWTSFSADLRSKSVAEAERMVWAFLGGYNDLVHPDDYASATTKPRVRQDWAIYEQALFQLEKSGAIPNGEETTPKWIANNEDHEAEAFATDDAFPVVISEKAKFWLGINIYNPIICRG